MTAHPVFISHSTQDKPFAEALRKALRDHEVEAWIDHRKLTAGGDLNEEIKTAIQDAHAFVVLFSKDAIKSRWVGKEIRWALGIKEGRKNAYTFIPVLLGDDVGPETVEMIAGRELNRLPEARQEILRAIECKKNLRSYRRTMENTAHPGQDCNRRWQSRGCRHGPPECPDTLCPIP